MPAFFSRHRVALIVALILLGLLLVTLWAGRLAEQRAWAERSQEARDQLQLYAQALHTQVERFRAVPALLALDGDIQMLLANPSDPALRQRLNQRLEEQNQAAGSSVLYLLDPQGETIAASNWRDWSSFVGNNYGFRPYFRDALERDAGRYFAVGVTTGIPGYFLASSVKNDAGEVLGVLVVKLELEDTQREWAGQSGILLVSDALDIVILSNRPAWRFRFLSPLGADVRERLVAARRYAEQTLQPLTSVNLQQIADDAQLRQVSGPDGERRYLWQSLRLPDEDWTLHLLHEPQLIAASVRSYRLAGAGAWLALAFLLLYLAQRRKTRRVEQQSRNELKRLIEERTRELRTAQDELVHAARMAALGQMSAALAHEIAQPLTALRMQLASQRLLLDNGRTEAVREGIGQIEKLLERMAALTGHLKTFARKSPAGLAQRLRLNDVLEQALQLLDARIRRDGVEVARRVPTQAWVSGDAIRLEQVLINLLSNALDAMAEQPSRRLRIDCERDGDGWKLSVADSGGGIASEHLEQIFEPFFTTKPVGRGLGLGLAVSYGIVRDLGGDLSARNDEQGAVFELWLPAAAEADSE